MMYKEIDCHLFFTFYKRTTKRLRSELLRLQQNKTKLVIVYAIGSTPAGTINL